MTLTLDAPRQVGGRYRDSGVRTDCRLRIPWRGSGTRQLTRPDSSVCRMPRLGEGAMLETKAGLCRGTIRVARARAVCVGVADRALAPRTSRLDASAASSVRETASLVAGVEARSAGTYPTAGVPPSAAGALRPWHSLLAREGRSVV